MLSYLLVAVFAVVLTLMLQRVIRVKVLLVLAAALGTATIFQLLAYLEVGYLDPFFIIALLFSSILAGVISWLTWTVLERIRAKKDSQNR